MCIQWNSSLMEEALQKVCRVENISASIVREYLFRKGCLDTLLNFERELPRNASSISNRAALIKELDLHKSFKRNKASEFPFRTILEVITEDILEKASGHPSICKVPLVSSAPNFGNKLEDKASKSSAQCAFSKDIVPSRKCLNQNLQLKNKTPLKCSEKTEKSVNKCFQAICEGDSLNSSLKIKARNRLPAFESECDKKQNSAGFSVSPTNPRERRRLQDFEGSPGKFSQGMLVNRTTSLHSQNKNSNDNKESRLTIKQLIQRKSTLSTIDMSHHNFDSAIEGRIFSLAAATPDDYTCLRPINADEACGLRILLFGNTKKTFGPEWSEQGFSFWDEPPLTYGMIQKKPGPCGVLAAVQAHVILELLFGVMKAVIPKGFVRPNTQEKREALARALTNILWQVGEGKGVVLAIKNDQAVLDHFVVPHLLIEDGLLEFLMLRIFSEEHHLLEYLFNMVPELEDGRNRSCVLFLYSALLTRGLEKIKEDMDNPGSHLIGPDGYCSQEVVNLLLMGQAVPNVFDGNMELYSGTPNKMTLHGIPGPSKIGQLSLYEYQNTCQVGNFYKNPIYPIWIILGESHFTVLFALSRDVFEKTEKGESFSLFHYDGLSKVNEEKHLTVEPSSARHLVPGTEDDFLPAVVRCIRTRWKDAAVTWNR